MPAIKDVVIAIPAYDNKTEFNIFQAIQDSISDPESPVSGMITYNGDSLVSRARNELALLFEQKPVESARFMMFIDSDIHIKPNDIKKLRAHNLPVVGGLYFFKNMSGAPVLNTPLKQLTDTLVQVRETGTGFLMIRRDTFGAIKSSGYAKQYKPGANQHLLDVKRTEYFPVGVKDDTLLSEDYYFCHLCEMVNIPVYVDRSVVVGHKGGALYPFKPELLIKALPMALRSFTAKDVLTQADFDEVVKAWGEYRERTGMNVVDLPVESEIVVGSAKVSNEIEIY